MSSCQAKPILPKFLNCAMCRRASGPGEVISVVEDDEGTETGRPKREGEEIAREFHLLSFGSTGSVSTSTMSSSLTCNRHAVGSRSSGCVAKIPGRESILKTDGRRRSRCVENHSKGRRLQAEIILLRTWWYFRYSLSYRDLEEKISERGLSVEHTTI